MSVEGLGPVAELANQVLPLTNKFYESIKEQRPDMEGYIEEFIIRARNELIRDSEDAYIATMGLIVTKEFWGDNPDDFTIEVYARLGEV